MLIDIYEIQDSFQAEDYDAICRGGDDSIAEESLESARAYVGLVAEKFGIEYDEDDPVLRLAVKKMDTRTDVYLRRRVGNSGKL